MASRCSPSRFYNVIKNLNEKQREAVRSIGFGNLLKLHDIRLRRTLLNWLLERYSPQMRSFHIGRHEIKVTKMDVVLIMGLRVVGTPVVPKHQHYPVDHLLSYYRARCGQIDVKFLEKLLQTTDYGDDFKRTFVLFTLCTLLAPKPRPEVSASFLQCLLDTEKIPTYAWGEFTLENLFFELDTYKREGHKYVGGCIILLQFWYYEHIQIPLEGLNNEPKKFPRLSSWDGFRCLRRDKKECQLGGYGLGQIVPYISPTSDEVLDEELKELLAMDPSNSPGKETCEGREVDNDDPLQRKTNSNEQSLSPEFKQSLPESCMGRYRPNQFQFVFPSDDDVPIILKNTTADFEGAKETASTVALELPYKLSTPSLIRCTKKRKSNPDINLKVDLLERAIQEQKNRYEELSQRLSMLEKLVSQEAKVRENKFTILEHALEDQKSTNEERKRLKEMERSASVPVISQSHEIACTSADQE